MFPCKVACPVLDLVDKLDVVLGHEWCQEHKVVISYTNEQVSFVYKDHPQVLRFDNSHAETRAPHSSLYSIRQATHFV